MSVILRRHVRVEMRVIASVVERVPNVPAMESRI
jgi:hypothetical protein